MTISSKSFEDLLVEIGATQLGLHEVQYTGHPFESALWEKNYSHVLNGVLDTLIDRSIKSRLGDPIEPNTKSFDFYTAVAEAWLNAIERGNRNDQNLCASLKLFIGETGIVARVRDSGKGFNPTHVLQDGIKERKGVGFRSYQSDNLDVVFENSGSSVNIAVYY